MYDLIPLHGALLGKKRAQIATVNKFLKRIDDGLKFDMFDDVDKLDKAQVAYEQLNAYYFNIMKSNYATSFIKNWFQTHPLYKIQDYIDTEREKIKSHIKIISDEDGMFKPNISKLQLDFLRQAKSSVRLEKIYSKVETPQSFRSILENALKDEIDTSFTVATLGGENNKVLLVTLNNKESFVCRFFNVIKSDFDKGLSAKQARERLKNLPYVVQPLGMKALNIPSDDQVYLEFSEYFPLGDLENHFKKLHRDANIDWNVLQDKIFVVADQLVQFYIKIYEEGAWFTDLKPGNILLGDNLDIRISDAKGFILSENRKVPIKHTNITENYLSSSVFDAENCIDLLSVQRKNLAVTLYQLLTNRLPKKIPRHSDTHFKWHLKFNFDDAVFQNQNGIFFQTLINDLYDGKIHSFKACDKILDNYLFESMSSSEAFSF